MPENTVWEYDELRDQVKHLGWSIKRFVPPDISFDCCFEVVKEIQENYYAAEITVSHRSPITALKIIIAGIREFEKIENKTI